MSEKPPNSGGEPADLSELTATDALLDRLGSRAVLDDDRLDPTVGALLQLVAVVDAPRAEPDTGLAHLVEVLAGRPLYLTEAASPPEVLDGDPFIHLEAGLTDRELAQSAKSQVIDLSAHSATDSAVSADPIELARPVEAQAADPAEPADPADPVQPEELAESARPIEIPAARTLTGSISTAPILIPAQAGARRWERALSQVSFPAASVLLLLAVSGGVSAAVTGDPMTPVNGVSRVMAQLPGLGNPQRSLTQVKGEITAASNAVRKNDAPSANRHLDAARRGLSDVPDDQKPQLRLMIANVETLLTGPLSPSPVVPTPPVGVEASTPPITSTPTPSTEPSASPTTVRPSADPSADPEPTATSSAPDDVPATTPDADPTPAPTESGS